MKEFNLSEKRKKHCIDGKDGYYEPEDVKEFIKRLDKLITIAWYEEWEVTKFKEEVYKLAGDVLK